MIAGFGDAVDNSNCWDPVISYVESQYESFLDAETRVHRVQMPDSRVHACLYFIAPSGHGLKPLDVEFMKRLHDKVKKRKDFFFTHTEKQTGEFSPWKILPEFPLWNLHNFIVIVKCKLPFSIQ